jgi:hypothetical protein
MDFIERWLHISPDGGSGASEILMVAAIVTIIVGAGVALRGHFPKSFVEYLAQLRKPKNGDRFDD